MARHAEVSAKSIVQAGKELELKGKAPNPGAIRAHLGYRGGLIRIKSIWDDYVKQRSDKLAPEAKSQINFDSLPESYANNTRELIKNLTAALEQLVLEAYINSRNMFEKRIQEIEKSEKLKSQEYSEAELAADESISRLEDEASQLQSELNTLADQNAQILLENAELRGRLAVFDERFQNHSDTRKDSVTKTGTSA